MCMFVNESFFMLGVLCMHVWECPHGRCIVCACCELEFLHAGCVMYACMGVSSWWVYSVCML